MTIEAPFRESSVTQTASSVVKTPKRAVPVVELPSAEAPVVYTSAEMNHAVDRACRRIAPLWPLRNFVAVNPFLGLADETFERAAEIMAQRAGAKMTAPRSFYAAAIHSGRITDADLAAALAAPQTVRRAARCDGVAGVRIRRRNIVDLRDAAHGGRHRSSAHQSGLGTLCH
ncbi:MAG: putative inorganic carbon transporter subunit DabA [Caldilineaceae bacterium]